MLFEKDLNKYILIVQFICLFIKAMTTKILNEEDNEKCETVWKNIRPSYVKRIHDTYKSRQEKAFERRKENKELKNRKKEITQSRVIT